MVVISDCNRAGRNAEPLCPHSSRPPLDDLSSTLSQRDDNCTPVRCSKIPKLMRRTIANLLVFVFAAGVCLPWLSAQAASPACCRIDGRHHCNTPAHGDGFHAAASPCPYGKVSALRSQTAFSPTTQLAVAFTPRQGAPVILTVSSHRLLNIQSSSGRSPPLNS